MIAEMGGKNAIIVDDDADLDEAVLGVVNSAFGYQGQKCSACSRAIVLDTRLRRVSQRLVEATRSLKVGPADDPATSVGPVIDGESVERIHRYIELGRKEAREVLAVDVGALAKKGYFVGPHIFADVPPDSRLAQEEIFGPVLAVHPRQGLERGARDRQRHRLRADRRHLLPQPGQPRPRRARVPGRQPVPQPQDHRRAGRPAAVRRLQDVRHRHQGRRAGLPVAVRAPPDDHRKHAAPRLCPTRPNRGDIHADRWRVIFGVPIRRPGSIWISIRSERKMRLTEPTTSSENESDDGSSHSRCLTSCS